MSKGSGPESNPILEWDPTAPEPESPDPNSATFARDFKSFVRKILLVTPEFPRFYADVLIDRAPNSNAAKILRKNYSKILEKVNMAVAQKQKSSRSCTHIKVSGIRCGSPSLRGEQFCYFHQRMHRGVRTPPQARLHPIALIEDEKSIQAALMEVINALMRNTIDLKRASLILRALHIAVKNAHRVHFSLFESEKVREVPDYAEPAPDHVGTAAPGGPGRAAAACPDTELDLPAVAATHEKPIGPDPTFWERWESGGKELARRAAEQRAAEARAAEQRAAQTVAPHVAPAAPTPTSAPTAQVLANGTAHIAADASVRPAPAASVPTAPVSHRTTPYDAPKKKPPVGVKKQPALKERKANARPSA